MPLNEKKIVKIILEECDNIEERCSGYKEELKETVADIIIDERAHSVQATNVQKKIIDKCNALGRYLAKYQTG